MRYVVSYHAERRLAERELAMQIYEPRALARNAYEFGTEPPVGFRPAAAEQELGEYVYRLYLNTIFVFAVVEDVAVLVTVYNNIYSSP